MKNPTSRLMVFMLALLLVMVLLLGYLRHAEAREIFNPHALEIDNPGQPVADLSTFAEADGQLPGTYRVTVYVNGERQGQAQDIAFISGPDKKLSAQVTPAMLK
ncbi:MAG: FimD/PapC N-terminal domain-containing protein, partial [Morganella morganii]